jgi:hypothetical protein
MHSPVQALKQVVADTLRKEGARGFYGGFSTVFMFSMPTNAIYFSSYVERATRRLSLLSAPARTGL